MYNIGIDLGGTNIKVGVVNDDFKIVGKSNIKTDLPRPAEEIADSIAKGVELACKEAGIDVEFVQDNQSSSHYGVLRGLHFQINYPQDKLVRVVNGEVFDVAVDLREGSKTYGKWFGVVLSAENKKQFFIPKGFAHGFLVLSESAEFTYKCSDFYHPGDEGGLIWNDPDIGVEWPIPEGMELTFSDKDQKWGSFKEFHR